MSKNRKKLVSVSSPGGKKQQNEQKNPKVVVWRCSVKKGILKNLKNLQENTCAGDFFKQSYWPQACNTIYWSNFLTYQILILLYYFHQKVSIEKTSVFNKQKPPLKVFHKNGVLKNLTKFTEKHLCRKKPGLCILRLYFFFPWYHELSLYKHGDISMT